MDKNRFVPAISKAASAVLKKQLEKLVLEEETLRGGSS